MKLIYFFTEFQNFDSSPYNYNTNGYSYSPAPADLYTPSPHYQPTIFTPSSSFSGKNYEARRSFFKDQTDQFADEPPLLEELEIYPHLIMEKTLSVLNPFQTNEKQAVSDLEFLSESDLAGPIGYYLALAFLLFLSDTRKDIFGYVYGLSIISVIFMYILLKLMCLNNGPPVSISNVASILGYSLLPIVCLSALGIFYSLNNKFGIILAIFAIFMSTSASSRIFCLITGDKNQRFLLAYPSALVYVIFTLLVLF
jgi:hypothetical protein